MSDDDDRVLVMLDCAEDIPKLVSALHSTPPEDEGESLASEAAFRFLDGMKCVVIQVTHDQPQWLHLVEREAVQGTSHHRNIDYVLGLGASSDSSDEHPMIQSRARLSYPMLYVVNTPS